MVWNAIKEWGQKRKLRKMLTDQRSARGFRSTGQLEKGIGADRATTERLLRSIGARKSEGIDEWTLNPKWAPRKIAIAANRGPPCGER